MEKCWVHWHKKSTLQSIGIKQNTALTHQEHITGKAKAYWHECIKSMFVLLLVWPSNYQLFVCCPIYLLSHLIWSDECCHLVDVVIFVAVSHAEPKQQHGLRPDRRPTQEYVLTKTRLQTCPQIRFICIYCTCVYVYCVAVNSCWCILLWNLLSETRGQLDHWPY